MITISVNSTTVLSEDELMESDIGLKSSNHVMNFTDDVTWHKLMSSFFTILKLSDYDYLKPSDALEWAEKYVEENE